MATLGVQRQSTMHIFTLREVSVIMQKRVISEAVPAAVSYTHLDVYKRQEPVRAQFHGLVHGVPAQLRHALYPPDEAAPGGKDNGLSHDLRLTKTIIL